MSYYLVQFVEDGLYHVCPKSHVRHNTDEPGLVSAKYKGIFFGAVVISEGEKDQMTELKERSITNDLLKAKYKIVSPVSHSPAQSLSATTSSLSRIKKDLFKTSTAASSSSTTSECLTPLVNVELEDEGKSVVNVGSSYQEHEVAEDLLSSSSQEPGGSIEVQEKMDVHDVDMDIDEEEIPGRCKKNVKKYYCPYCRTLYKQLARHFFQVHSGEPEIASVMNLDKNNPDRRRVLSSLRAKGSKIFNALQSSPSKIIVPRTKKPFNIQQYIQCYLCGSMYKSKFLHRHIKKCPNSQNEPTKQALRTAKKNKYLEKDNGEQSIKFFQDVLSGMRDGELKNEIQKDPLLVSYGRFMCSYYGVDKHLVNHIRRKLRQVTAVLIEVKKNDNEIVSLKDIFQPSKKHVLFNSIKTVTGFEKGSFKRPAMANEMATLLKQCAKRFITEAQEEDNEEDVKKAKTWIEVINEDYNAYIAKHARKTLETNQWNKPKTLPLTDDVMKLNKHVKHVTDEATASLTKEFSFPQWSNLNKGTMVKLLLFNRKRVGDVKRITINDFNKAHNVQKGTVTYDMLSESEKLLCSQYQRLQARGKRGKAVSMLLTKDIMSNIKTILQLREKANIPQSNPYVFAKSNEDVFQANVALKEFVFECKAKFPQFITGTSLRKEIATATQAFNFSLNDMTILANFLGHTLQTHSQFYRLPDEAVQLAKISAVLQAIDSGKVAELKGKSLNELNTFVESFINEQDKTPASPPEQEEDDPGVPSLQPSTPRKPVKIVRKTWTTPERSVMKQYFKHHLVQKTLPTPLECYEAKQRYSPIKCRTVAQIKAWVYNQHQKKKRKVHDTGV